MVKQAENKRKRSPFLPILGLFLAVVMLVIAWGGAQLLVAIPNVKRALSGMAFVKLFGQQVNQGQLLLTFVLWLILLAFAYFLVAILAGKDPESTKDIPMPPRGKEKRPPMRR